MSDRTLYKPVLTVLLIADQGMDELVRELDKGGYSRVLRVVEPKYLMTLPPFPVGDSFLSKKKKKKNPRAEDTK